MAQRAKPIDLTRTYLPVDPNTLTETMHGTQGEDAPENRVPVVPYEGWNFMPTGYGWRSYFGINGTLGISALALPDRCRDIFVFQKSDLSNLLVALCDTGIWIKQGETAGAWVQNTALTDPADGTLLQWSHCIIENVLYVYRQGAANIYVFDGTTFDAETPTTLTMAGQLGIFKAGGRLGIWDSDDAMGISSKDDKMDFTPDVGTQANITKITALVGKMVNILQHGDGFIIYGTKSIIGVVKDPNNTFLWRAVEITTSTGIAYRQQACLGAPDTIHFAWTSIGLMKIENFKAEIVTPDFYDFLKESQDPVYLKVLEGRYLFVYLADVDYVDGIVTFYTATIPGGTISIPSAILAITERPAYTTVDSWASYSDMRAYFNSMNTRPGIVKPVDEAECRTRRMRCTGVNFGTYEDHILIPLLPNTLVDPDLTVLVDQDASSVVWDTPLYIDGAVNFGSVPAPFTANVSGTVTPQETVALPNGNNFYSSVFAIYEAYNRFVADWLTEWETKVAALAEGANTVNSFSNATVYTLPIGSKGAANLMSLVTIGGISPAAGLNGTNRGFHLNVPSEFVLSYQRSDELFWVEARPTQLTGRELALATQYSRYKYPFVITVSNATGDKTLTEVFQIYVDYDAIVPSGATFNAGARTITCANATQFGLVMTMINDRDTYSGEAIRQLNIAVATAATLRYINKDGVNVAVGGETLTYSHGSAIVSAWSESATFTFHDNGPTDFTFDIAITAAGLESADTLTYTVNDQVDVDPCALDALISWSYPSSYFQYDADGEVIESPDTPAALVMTTDASNLEFPEIITTMDSCTVYPARTHPQVEFMSMSISTRSWSVPASVTIGDYTVSIDTVTTEETYTYPESSFLMQSGDAAPYDILWKGAFVYDTQYKRWGKMKQDFRQLLDYSPINSAAVNTVPYTVFGVNGALLADDGYIKTFDTLPSDSYLKFGKIGIFRMGYTTLEEVKAHFRLSCTGSLEVESSLDGRSVELGLTKTYDYAAVKELSQGIGNSARWHNIAFRGQFDLSYLEFRAWPAARR